LNDLRQGRLRKSGTNGQSLIWTVPRDIVVQFNLQAGDLAFWDVLPGNGMSLKFVRIDDVVKDVELADEQSRTLRELDAVFAKWAEHRVGGVQIELPLWKQVQKCSRDQVEAVFKRYGIPNSEWWYRAIYAI
jgi:hypothetical protein